MGLDAPSQPILATSLARNQRLTHFTLDSSAMENGGAIRVRRLLEEDAWSARTIGARASQWKFYRMFCLAEGRALAPVTEQQLVAYVGWLAKEREAGRRSVSADSLPQYITAARFVARSLFGGDTATTTMPLLRALQRAYSKWEAQKYPSLTHRGGVPADIVQTIWSHAMQSQVRNFTRDGAAIVLAYVLGLCESALLSLPAEGVTWDEHKVTAQLVVVKGKAVRHSIPSSYQRCATDLPSFVDLVARWGGMRTAHPLFFGMPGEPME
jgi:hypothetical protein